MLICVHRVLITVCGCESERRCASRSGPTAAAFAECVMVEVMALISMLGL